MGSNTRRGAKKTSVVLVFLLIHSVSCLSESLKTVCLIAFQVPHIQAVSTQIQRTYQFLHVIDCADYSTFEFTGKIAILNSFNAINSTHNSFTFIANTYCNVTLINCVLRDVHSLCCSQPDMISFINCTTNSAIQGISPTDKGNIKTIEFSFDEKRD